MFYSELVKKACLISFEAHKNDKDKGGYPYIYHPFYLASQFDSENEVCVALLHDVIEDHGDLYSFELLTSIGFNDNIIDALKLLTHDDNIPYMDYIKEIGKNDIAKSVKIADLKHNLDIRRTNGKESPKLEIYKLALEYLESIKELID